MPDLRGPGMHCAGGFVPELPGAQGRSPGASAASPGAMLCAQWVAGGAEVDAGLPGSRTLDAPQPAVIHSLGQRGPHARPVTMGQSSQPKTPRSHLEP